MPRCPWAKSELAIPYHDAEWGVPVHEDRVLFEFLTLEAAQAGLSWDTILKKRDGYRTAFHGFDVDRIARYGAGDVKRLMGDASIVRNRLKIESTIANARACLNLREAGRSLDGLLWGFVDGVPIDGKRRAMTDIPAKTAESMAMSKELVRLGFRFVGPTICYALMQAVGMANDHLITCPRHKYVSKLTRVSSRK
ncbi:MAG: DNA-3-methyladenine glycosylase I [Planctomycetes bacterium]|nr:DNA-3-methyladenine glycosylase I [Planctomycetota bacterium]